MALSTHIALVLGVAIVSAVGVGVVLWVALGHPPLRPAGNWTTSNSFEFVKIVLALAGGVGAVVALVVAYRKQHLGETAERREDIKLFAERFTKASDQLGSDKAAVRLAGMYALEDLAQGTPSQRQTIVNVLCAYLRMPYLPASAPSSGGNAPVETTTSTAPAEDAGAVLDQCVDHDENERRQQERQVRLTAQRILGAHLRPQDDGARVSDAFWQDIDLDLTGATLVGLDLRKCHVRTAKFDNAVFSEGALFRQATFNGNAWFSNAIFDGDTGFREATFCGQAWFSEVAFNGYVGFGETRFSGYAGFGEAVFRGDAGFGDVTFAEGTGFGKATFCGQAWFSKASFSGNAGFAETSFSVYAGFGKSTFCGDARFDNATFDGQAWFGGAAFNGRAGFDEASFSGYAGFGEASFNGVAGFYKALFREDAGFGETSFNGDTKFDEATFARGAAFDRATFEGNAGFEEVTFNGRAGFGRATFNGRAGFSRARFGGQAWFGGTMFGMRPCCVDARVRLDATLVGARTWPDGVTATEPSSQDKARLPDLEGTWGYLQAAIVDHLPPADLAG
ncbi:pentapeptide repeat-containing protein [Lentzea rhizosphaerae]|uniref:Pentapeptide repeat-containing protein n=1 Tax=Lentzea rhizosphaerae TaxID=2041025 RepID=A0ABV8C8V0_9PSEU